ncbi:MAG: glycosyltransferase [Chloroflexota bacterium]|nr:glycosyltransferase [Chloroflexota bacterium]
MAGSDLRLLIVTRIWPTPEAPSSGIFVANRCEGMANVTVARAMHQHRHWVLALLAFLWDTVRVRGRFDGVEAHVVYPAGLVGWVTARLRRIPIVVYAHGTDVREAPNRGRGYRLLAGWVVRHADVVVTNSSDTRAHVRRLGGDALIAPPGIPLDRYRPTPRPADRRVLYLGGRNPRKGHDVAMGLADTMVGPGIRDVPPGEVPELMAAHDVVLVPSTAEPFGLVALEGIASGRWVVASDVGGLRDIVIDGVNGTLVADGNFAGALARVPDYDPDGIARTVRRFSIERWQADLDSIWRGVLAQGHRRG